MQMNFENFYEILKNNETKANELEQKRKQKKEEIEQLLKQDAYDKYKECRKISYFIKDIISNYSSSNTELTNTFFDRYYYDQIKEFINKYNLATIECNAIIWSKGKTVKDLIDAYYKELAFIEERLVTTEDLKQKYQDIFEHDQELYGSLIKDTLYNTSYLKNCDLSNISCKILYYLQYWFEKYNFNLGQFDDREFDMSIYDGSAIWEETHPNPSFSNFYHEKIKLSELLFKILKGDIKFDINTIRKDELEILIRDIETLKLPEEIKQPVNIEEPITKNKSDKKEPIKVTVSRSRIYKNNHKRK